MRPETNVAFHKALKQIKDLHRQKEQPFSDLRIVVRIYADERFEVVYICPPENDPIFFSWPNNFMPNLKQERPEKIVLLKFTEQGIETPVIEFRKAIFIILNRYLKRDGQGCKFVVHVVVKNDIFSISVISREESLNQIAMYGARIQNEDLLPSGDGDYLVQIKKGQIVFSDFST